MTLGNEDDHEYEVAVASTESERFRCVYTTREWLDNDPLARKYGREAFVAKVINTYNKALEAEELPAMKALYMSGRANHERWKVMIE